MTNPTHIAEAYLAAARINHYLIGVVGNFTYAELEAASQILISQSNAAANADPTIELALDLIESRLLTTDKETAP